MRPVAPRLKGVEERSAGEDTPDLKPLTVGQCFSTEGTPVIITRWRFSEEDLARISRGEDLFIYFFSQFLPSIQIAIGSKFHELDD